MPTLTDAVAYFLIPVVAACIGGMLGAAFGYAGARAIYDRITREVLVEIETTAATITAPVIVDLQIRQPKLEPLSIPVEAEIVQTTPNLELTRRILMEAPKVSVRGLSRIFQCSPSTAQTYYMQSLRAAGANVTPDSPLDLPFTEGGAAAPTPTT